jgi:2C-methyl-D-erythritol 2,4-cyclodiphosphate synthase
MLRPILEILNKHNFYINNLRYKFICEKPKVQNIEIK